MKKIKVILILTVILSALMLTACFENPAPKGDSVENVESFEDLPNTFMGYPDDFVPIYDEEIIVVADVAFSVEQFNYMLIYETKISQDEIISMYSVHLAEFGEVREVSPEKGRALKINTGDKEAVIGAKSIDGGLTKVEIFVVKR